LKFNHSAAEPQPKAKPSTQSKWSQRKDEENQKLHHGDTEKNHNFGCQCARGNIHASAEKNLKAYLKEHREKNRGHGEIL